MSTQRPSSKAAAKRRAERRKQTREISRQVLAILFVLIFVCGTVSTAFVFQSPLSPGTTQPGVSDTPLADLTPANVVVNELVQQGDTAAAQNDWATAAARYKAAVGLSAGNATLHFKAGRANINNKDYAAGIDQLQLAINLNPSAEFVTEAQALIDANKDKATAVPTGAGTAVPITGTVTSPGGSQTITATTTITP